jgi:hypothetical protein
MKRLILITIAAFTLQGCAAIISGSHQKVTIHTNTKDGVIYQNFEKIGFANQEVKIKRNKIDNMYTISAEGCRDTSFVLEENFNWVCWFDVINPLGLALDYSLGSQYKTNDSLYIEMDCDSIIHD